MSRSREEMKQRTVKQIVEMMFKYQGHKADLSDTSTNGNVQDCWAHKILDVIIRDNRSLQHSPSEFAFNRLEDTKYCSGCVREIFSSSPVYLTTGTLQPAQQPQLGGPRVLLSTLSQPGSLTKLGNERKEREEKGVE
jgi:hypothetical protein